MSLHIQSSSSNARISGTGQLSTPSPEEIGKMLQALTAEQIESLANKMTGILSKNLPISSDSQVRSFYLTSDEDPNDHLAEVLVNAKSDFLSKTPFKRDITDALQYGAGSILANGGVLEYCYKTLLNHYIKTSELPACEHATAYQILEKELGEHDQYRITLSLNLGKDSTLVFVITEKTGELELTKTSFSLKDLNDPDAKSWYDPIRAVKCFTYENSSSRLYS